MKASCMVRSRNMRRHVESGCCCHQKQEHPATIQALLLLLLLHVDSLAGSFASKVVPGVVSPRWE
jgi:hypothetical protein